MNMNTLRAELRDLAESIRYDVVREWMSTTSSTELDELIHENIAYMADNKCIYTHEVRELVRFLEDEDTVDEYDELLCEGMSRDAENTAIAYMFWSDNLHWIVGDMFAEEVSA